MRRLKAYLADLQHGALDQSEQIERTKKRYQWLWVAVVILLCAFLVFGLLTAIR
jgi:hypothetical protein